MVCMLGRTRMAAMTRLLASGGHMDITTDEDNHERMVVQTINREFCEADEASLLEEEDMHVFDSRPMTDPLHLVCCNACKKPIKASQYTAHAERCRLFSSSEESGVELDGASGRKNPPRKGRRKLPTAHGSNKGTPVTKQEKSESIEADDFPGAELKLNDQNGTFSCVFREGTNKSDPPAPLATKIYHPRGSNRLRAALGYLYRESQMKDVSHFSSPGLLLPLKENCSYQNDAHPLITPRNPDLIMAQSSDSCLGASNGLTSAMSCSNQFHENNLSGSDLNVGTATVGTIRMRYHSSPHSFPGNPGTAIGALHPQVEAFQ